MVINILFLTITIKMREISVEEAVQQDMVERLYTEHKDRQYSMNQFRL